MEGTTGGKVVAILGAVGAVLVAGVLDTAGVTKAVSVQHVQGIKIQTILFNLM